MPEFKHPITTAIADINDLRFEDIREQLYGKISHFLSHKILESNYCSEREYEIFFAIADAELMDDPISVRDLELTSEQLKNYKEDPRAHVFYQLSETAGKIFSTPTLQSLDASLTELDRFLSNQWGFDITEKALEIKHFFVAEANDARDRAREFAEELHFDLSDPTDKALLEEGFGTTGEETLPSKTDNIIEFRKKPNL